MNHNAKLVMAKKEITNTRTKEEVNQGVKDWLKICSMIIENKKSVKKKGGDKHDKEDKRTSRVYRVQGENAS